MDQDHSISMLWTRQEDPTLKLYNCDVAKCLSVVMVRLSLKTGVQVYNKATVLVFLINKMTEIKLFL